MRNDRPPIDATVGLVAFNSTGALDVQRVDAMRPGQTAVDDRTAIVVTMLVGPVGLQGCYARGSRVWSQGWTTAGIANDVSTSLYPEAMKPMKFPHRICLSLDDYLNFVFVLFMPLKLKVAGGHSMLQGAVQELRGEARARLRVADPE